MTTIQQVLFEVETPYMGHPYYVTGHALYNAIARRVDADTRQALCVSHGVFVPGEYGRYPDTHSQSGGAPYMGKQLRPVDTYDDLFLFRAASQRWLNADRSRDLHNAFDLQRHGDRLAVAPTTYVGRPESVRSSMRSVTWFIHCYLHTEGATDDVLPLAEETLDGLRVGGGRNYGLGELSVADTQTVELSDLSASRLTEADPEAYVIELLTPYVLASEYPGADSQSVPWWWEPAVDQPPRHPSAADGDSSSGDGLRRRQEQLIVDGQTHAVATVDHGQLVGYAGDEPVQTAWNGVRRIGTHAKYGFGEFRIRPLTDETVQDQLGGAVAKPSVAAESATTGGFVTGGEH